MKHYIRNVVWKFSDCTLTYPDIPNDKVYILNLPRSFGHQEKILY
jgi:hypothetical protein